MLSELRKLADSAANPLTTFRELAEKVPELHDDRELLAPLERGAGIIINLGSYIAIRPSSMATAYATSKAALARFTDCLAMEVAERGVQVFCVSPGLVLTDMTRDLPFIGDIPDEEFNNSEEVASLACELITGNYAELTGHFIHVSDDLPELLTNVDRLKEQRLYQLSLHGMEGLIE